MKVPAFSCTSFLHISMYFRKIRLRAAGRRVRQLAVDGYAARIRDMRELLSAGILKSEEFFERIHRLQEARTYVLSDKWLRAWVRRRC